MSRLRTPVRHAQRGAAALIVVLLLFFITSLVAAYAGRNLIFEQKTSANQYRATQAFEAAEAGLEWALAMLNGGLVTAACVPPSPLDIVQRPFRERFLELDPTTGNYTPRAWDNAGTPERLRPSCVRNGADWNCSCSDVAAPTPVVPVGNGINPAFRVCFEQLDPPQPGAVRVVSTGRTSFVDQPCEVRGEGTAGDAAATVSVVVAFSSALVTPPSAALTVRGNVDVGSAEIQFDSFGPLGNALMISSGGPPNALNAQPPNLQGTPIQHLIPPDGDSILFGLSPQQMFSSLFRMDMKTYKYQPAAVRLGDCATACSAKLRDAWLANPGRVIWVDGDMTLESDVDLGSEDDPVLIVSTGNINLDATDIKILGLLYSQAVDWDNDGLGAAVVRGAAVAEGNFIGSGTPTFQYDPEILKLLNRNVGSLVRVPGSWRDFP